MKNYLKGSEWREWNLHIHTPSSYDYEDKSVTEEEFVSNLKRQNIIAVAITDHHIIDTKRIFKIKELAGEELTIFPGIELKSELGGSESVHFVGIFPETLNQEEVKDIWTKISGELKLTPSDIKQIGGNDRVFSNLKEASELIHSLGGLVTVHAGTKSNSIENIKSNLEKFKDALKEKLVTKYIDILEIGKPKDINDYKKIVFPNIGMVLPLILASDNHNIKKYKNNRFTWIKADPTFEGLKQIIFEPEERVKIQENSPEFEFDKPTFAKISIVNPIEIFQGEKVKFNKTELPLSKNLVTIIGGRGSGKSLLLNYIANTFNKPIFAYQRKDKSFVFNNSEYFKIEWQKNNNPKPEVINFNAKDKGNLDFIFIEQGKLKNIVDYRILWDEIKKLLKIEDLKFDENVDNEIIELLKDIKELKGWFEYENEKGEKINNREFNEKKKREAKKLLETITTEENKQKLETYTSNIKKISDYNNLLSKSNELRENLEKYQKDLNKIIKNINSKIQTEENDLSIPNINFEEQLKAMESVENKFNELLDSKKNENNEIKKQFEEQGYKGDLNRLLNNAEKYQKDIQNSINKLKDIEEKEKQLEGKKKQRRNLSKKLKNEYERQKKIINEAWKNILNTFTQKQKEVISKILEKRNISIDGLIYFDRTKFDVKLNDYLDKRKYKNLSENLGIKNLDDYWKFIEKELESYLEGEKRETTKRSLDDLFFSLKERRDYLYVRPEIKYMGKRLDQLSVGQRGTLYLLLQLATNAFASPLIFDQPEDDLDNEFITVELVDLFKELKRYRQIIISTHNANLVVTTDAEQVIVADNENEELSYFSGSLENPKIIEKVCNILEGGKDAFKKRERRYISLNETNFLKQKGG
ncbi:MAG: TrlF family AAA-like ATPase [Promethearchaeota archaeon]